MTEHEHAVKRGDAIGAEMADERIDAVLNEARAERQPEPAPSFDGGVRRPVAPPQRPLTLQHLIGREMDAREAVAAHARANRDAWERATR